MFASLTHSQTSFRFLRSFSAFNSFSVFNSFIPFSAFHFLHHPQLPVLFFLTASAFTDLYCRKIPNLLVLLTLFPGGFLLGPPFLLRLLVACAVLLPLYRTRLIGGGDIKLLASVAAWSGFSLFLRFFFFSLLIASVPALILFLRGQRRTLLPMGPFFLFGWICSQLFQNGTLVCQ